MTELPPATVIAGVVRTGTACAPGVPAQNAAKATGIAATPSLRSPRNLMGTP